MLEGSGHSPHMEAAGDVNRVILESALPGVGLRAGWWSRNRSARTESGARRRGRSGGKPGADQVAAVSRRSRYEQRTVSGRRRAPPEISPFARVILHAVPHARSARKATTKRAGGHHAHLAAHDGEHDRALAALVELADGLGVLAARRRRAPSRRRSRAAARRRTRPRSAAARRASRGRRRGRSRAPRARPRRAPGRRAAPGSARHSTQNAGDGSTVHQRHAPSTPATRLTRAAASAAAWATCVICH